MSATQQAQPFEPTIPFVYPWGSQARQYPGTGPAGVSYFAGEVGGGAPPVDCLLYRDADGVLLGILNYYSVDYDPWEKAGNVNIWVRRDAQRRGIGSALLTEAVRRWSVDLHQQRFTPAGAAFATAFVTTTRTNQEDR